ncbi:Major facilitator superfamily domain general substrate transporter [Penicillium expansum]|nr:Major facilitator superfamily domain general substrate transporter [Penicillium expansum]
MGTFMAAGIIPAYDAFAEQYNVTVPDASYLTSCQILLLGLSPLIWNPVTAVYGRYHITLLSVLGSMSYLNLNIEGKKLGWWTLMTTIGTPAGPFFMGFVIKNIGVQWIFWIFAILNFCQFLVYLAIGDETIYNPDNERKVTGFWGKLILRKISSHSLKPLDFVAPFSLARYPRILIIACAHAITFCYSNIALIVEMPIAFGERFHFDAQQIGLQFIAIVIGCVLGEQVSGPMCDWFLARVRKSRGRSCPADRLWLSYIAFVTIFAGLLTWGFQLQHATIWNVTPCVGAAIASFGNQMQTTILTTFAVESRRDRASQLGPFYFPDMFTALGFGGAAGVMVAIIGGCALLPTIAVQFVSTRAEKR